MASPLRRRRRRTCALTAACLVAPAAVALFARQLQQTQPQQPERPVFRAQVNMVEVDVVATDAAGRPVVDLTPADLQVFEDGRPQKIASFVLVNLPVPPAHEPPARDVATNAAAEDGRLFFLVLDDIYTPQSQTDQVKRIVRAFVERLAPQDQVALLFTSLEKDSPREFTTDHAAVLRAVDTFHARMSEAQRRFGRGNVTDSGDLQSFDLKGYFDRVRPYSILEDVSNFLSAIPRRRKALVYVGPGWPATEAETVIGRYPDSVPKDLFDPVRSRAQEDDFDVIQAVRASRRGNVAFYALDPSPPPRFGEEELAPASDRMPAGVLDLATLRQQALGTLSEATGGFVARATDAGPAVARVIADTSSYYLLGYYSDAPADSAAKRFLGVFSSDPWRGFRTIEVRTTRPGVTIRARKGYWNGDVRPNEPAPPPRNAREEVSRDVSGVLPKSDLVLRAYAAAFRGPDSRKASVAVAVEVSAQALATPAGAEFSDEVEMLTVAIEPGEKVRLTDAVTTRVTLGAATVKAFGVTRYLICTRLALAPGPYQLRIGVRSARAARSGSVYHDLTVPDFTSEPLSLSGLAIRQAASASPMPAARTRTMAGLLPFTPVLTREFSPSEEAWVYAKVYRGRKGARGAVVLTTTIRLAGEETEVWRDERTLTAADLGPGAEREHHVRLPLDKLPAGRYRLRVSAETSGATTFRELDFVVRP